MAENDTIIKKKNIVWVVTSNILTLLTAITIGFVLPKFVSFETYAGYRTYTLYIGFASLFHLGFINGIALRFGDTDYRDLPAGRFKAYTASLCLMELGFQVVLFGIYLIWCFASGNYFEFTPVLFVIVNLLFTNLRHYFSTLDKFSARFTVDGALLVLYDVLQLAGFGILLFLGSDKWMTFLLYTTAINIFINIAYMVGNTRVVAGGEKAYFSRQDIFSNIRRGSFVMLGEMIGIGILGIDSIFAQLFFDDKSFSQYTFAVYIVVAAYTLMSAAESMIFPYLKRLDDKDMKGSYLKLKRWSTYMSAVMFLGIIVLRPLIGLFLPAYTQSIHILEILGGTLMFRALQGLSCGNFFRSLDMEKQYFKCNALAFGLAVISDTAVYLVFRDLRPIAFASVFVFALWFVLSDVMITKKLQGKPDAGDYTLILFILAVYYLIVNRF